LRFDTLYPQPYIPAMRPAAFLLLLLLATGCSSWQPTPTPQSEEDKHLFSPVDMRLATFSKLKSWSGSGAPEGIEALLEFDDQFDDRTKAAGAVYFELYSFRPGWPDPRGSRIVNPWSGSLQTYDDQKAHWERASGAYNFRLACAGLEWNKDYVLAATFQSPSGQRFFSQIILPAEKPEAPTPTETPVAPTTEPSSHAPGERYPQP
jgi:hypothetical protein